MLCWETKRDLAALKGESSFWLAQCSTRDTASRFRGFLPESQRAPAQLPAHRSATHLAPESAISCTCFTLTGSNQASNGQFYC